MSYGEEKIWTDDRNIKLEELKKLGLTNDVIGQRMGVSGGAISKQWRKLRRESELTRLGH